MRFLYASFLVLTIFFSLSIRAQTAYWYAAINGDLNAWGYIGSRLDDIYFWNRNTGVAVTSIGSVLRTIDGGTYWSRVFVDPSEPYMRSVEASDNGAILIAGSVDGVAIRSVDYGQTWMNISSSIPDTGSDARNICGLAHAGNNTFYGVGWYGAQRARFYKTTDAGVSWDVKYVDTALASGLVDVIRHGNLLFASGSKNYISGRQESVVLRSADEGESWTKVFSDTVIGGRIWKLQFVTPTLAYGSIQPTFGMDTVAIIRSTDGGATWGIVPVGHAVSNWVGTQGIGFTDSLRGFVGGYYPGFFMTTDGAVTWQRIPLGVNFNRFFRYDAGLVYATGDKLYVFSDTAASAASLPAAPSREVVAHTLSAVSPNPASKAITVTVRLHRATNFLFDLVDLSGRRVHSIARGRRGAGATHLTSTVQPICPVFMPCDWKRMRVR